MEISSIAMTLIFRSLESRNIGLVFGRQLWLSIAARVYTPQTKSCNIGPLRTNTWYEFESIMHIAVCISSIVYLQSPNKLISHLFSNTYFLNIPEICDRKYHLGKILPFDRYLSYSFSAVSHIRFQSAPKLFYNWM